MVSLGMAGNGVVGVVGVEDLLGAMASLGVEMGDDNLGAGAMTTGLGAAAVVTVELLDPDQLEDATVELTDGKVR